MQPRPGLRCQLNQEVLPRHGSGAAVVVGRRLRHRPGAAAPEIPFEVAGAVAPVAVAVVLGFAEQRGAGARCPPVVGIDVVDDVHPHRCPM